MRKKLASCALLLSLCLSLLTPAGESRAAATSVKVTLPEFTVKLNGHSVENQYREHPLLVYKDITYIPMTWYDSRLLGLEANWSPENGLSINESRVASSYMPYKTDRRNEKVYYAEAPTSTITINSESIENSKEEYPLLSFRDVTYFPLTWRFAHDKFGWEYRWDSSEGLSIQSHNPQLQAVDIPTDSGDRDVAVFKGYFYFTETTGTTNKLMRAPIQNPTAKDSIYSYDIESAYGMGKWYSFQIRENELWFVYHIGGALMGRDVFVKVGDDGNAEVGHQGYLDFRNTPYGTLILNQGVPPEGNNLTLAATGQKDQVGKSVGNPDLIYGMHIIVDATGVGVSGDASSTTVIGDYVYVLASVKTSTGYSDLNKIYRINLNTNETVKIVNAEVGGFRIFGNTLFYIKDSDDALYSSALDGTGERKLTERPVSWFDAIDGNVYYTTIVREDRGKFHLYQVSPDGEDSLVLRELLDSVQVFNRKLICRLDEEEAFGVKLLDSSGRPLLSITDPVARVLKSDDAIFLMSSRDFSVKMIR